MRPLCNVNVQRYGCSFHTRLGWVLTDHYVLGRIVSTSLLLNTLLRVKSVIKASGLRSSQCIVFVNHRGDSVEDDTQAPSLPVLFIV